MELAGLFKIIENWIKPLTFPLIHCLESTIHWKLWKVRLYSALLTYCLDIGSVLSVPMLKTWLHFALKLVLVSYGEFSLINNGSCFFLFFLSILHMYTLQHSTYFMSSTSYLIIYCYIVLTWSQEYWPSSKISDLILFLWNSQEHWPEEKGVTYIRVVRNNIFIFFLFFVTTLVTFNCWA